MAKINSYKELLAYQKAYEIAKTVYEITKSFPQSELYGIVSQMRRAAISVPSNIAEGFRRSSRKEYIQFLRIASGSNAELETQLLLSRDLGFVKPDKFKDVYNLNEEVGRLLTSYIMHLKSTR